MNGKTGSHSCWNLFKLRNVLSCIDVWPVACRVLYPLYRLILDLLVFIFFSFNLERISNIKVLIGCYFFKHRILLSH